MPTGHKSASSDLPQPPALRSPSALTELEGRILDYMVLYLRRNTYQPSIREIGRQFGIKSTKTVSEQLQSLADKGFIERDPARSRGIRILGVDLGAQTVSVPCFRDLREAADGLRTGRADLRVNFDARMMGRAGGFMVRAPRDRLAAAGVGEGDFLVIQPIRPDELADGDLVVARANGPADYYQVRKRDSRLFLHAVGGEPVAEGGAHRPAAPPVIVGRVAALYRRMGPLRFAAPIGAH